MVGTAPAFLLTEYCLWEPYYHLTDNAPEADKKTLEEYMNREIFVGLWREKYPQYKNPYYLWDGNIIDLVCIRVEKAEDAVSIVDYKICVKKGKYELFYLLEDIKSINILTTDTGPSEEDMWLSIDFGDDTEIRIASGHSCYAPFLFEQLGQELPLDYEKIIDASQCTERNSFEIFWR